MFERSKNKTKKLKRLKYFVVFLSFISFNSLILITFIYYFWKDFYSFNLAIFTVSFIYFVFVLFQMSYLINTVRITGFVWKPSIIIVIFFIVIESFQIYFKGFSFALACLIKKLVTWKFYLLQFKFWWPKHLRNIKNCISKNYTYLEIY